MSKLLIKYASRSRPDRVLAVVDSVFKHATMPERICLLLSLDSDDKTVYNKEFLTKLKPYIEKYDVQLFFSPRTTKIGAYNRDIEKVSNWSYLLHITDFTEICFKGFDEWILESMNTHISFHYSSNTNGKYKHKIPVVPKVYYDEIGYLYNPKLKANFSYKEIKNRDFGHPSVSIPMFKYYHPRWLYFSPDQLHLHNIRFWKQDLETLERIKNEN